MMGEKHLMDQETRIEVSVAQEWDIPTRVQNVSYLLPLFQPNMAVLCFYIVTSAGGLETTPT